MPLRFTNVGRLQNYRSPCPPGKSLRFGGSAPLRYPPNSTQRLTDQPDERRKLGTEAFLPVHIRSNGRPLYEPRRPA